MFFSPFSFHLLKNENLKLIYFPFFVVVSSQPSPIPSNNIRNPAFIAISSHKAVPEKLQTRILHFSSERKRCMGWRT